MILDLEKFIRTEQPYWQQLETELTGLEQNRAKRLSLDEIQNFYSLYQRASADLGKLKTFSTNQQIRQYLENLVGRTYAEIHEVRENRVAFSPKIWFCQTLPRTFRKHLNPFLVVLVITSIGCGFGGLLVTVAPETKDVLLPFAHLYDSPTERVAREMADEGQRLQGSHAGFSAQLMTNNIWVSIFAMGLGITYGIGTLIIIFYNGVILGAICFDYIIDGQGVFLAGWLLPHGSVEIPAFLLAGQTGLLLAHALIGHGDRVRLPDRLRAIVPDIATLIGGIALFLVWAGIVESFFSQYHEPIVPYWLKITFGSLQLCLVLLFLGVAGKQKHETP